MRAFSYARPESATAAVQASAAAGAGARWIAAGTTLDDLIKLDIERPQHLIDVTAARGLEAVETRSDRLRVEALAPMSVVATDKVVLRDDPPCRQAIGQSRWWCLMTKLNCSVRGARGQCPSPIYTGCRARRV